MTQGIVKTQGTEVFFIDTVSSSTPGIVKLLCPTGVSGLGGPADQIDTTCLDARVERTYERGLGNPGQVSVPFNFIPSAISHQILFDLKVSGENVSWLVALSDGVDQPGLASDDAFDPPTDRTSLGFTAYVSDINIDIATNEVVRGTLTLQRSGEVTTYFNGPTP
jgi:hypothetical protein